MVDDQNHNRASGPKIESCVMKACAGTSRMTSHHENKLTCVIWNRNKIYG